MTVDGKVCAEVLARLQPLGDVTGRRLFGGYGFWEDGAMFGLVHGGDVLHLKADAQWEPALVAAGCTPFTAESSSGRTMVTSYWSVPADVLADDERFEAWARRAIAVGHATARGRRGKARPSAKRRPS